MSLSKVQKSLNKTSRIIGDVNAAKKGTLNKRLKNRYAGKTLKKLFK